MSPFRSLRASFALLPLALAAVLAAGAVLAACGTSSRGGVTAPAPNDLAAVEVRDYRGEKLGSVNDFRENSIKGPQQIDRATYTLRVDGDVERPATYTYSDVLSKETTYTKVVTLNCVEGWSVRILWEGVLLTDLIDRAGPNSDAVTVIFHAADGYTTSLPLQFVRDGRLLLAYRMNGIEIPPERGFPFQVVAESKYGYKWCKWVTRIELSPLADYRGYWESRGYSNDADPER